MSQAPGSTRRARLAEGAASVGIVLAGMAAGAALVRAAFRLPRAWLSSSELWAFRILLVAALLVAVARLAGWFPATLRWPRMSAAAALAATLVLFCLPIAFLAATGHTTYSALGGQLPWSDAGAYFYGANNILGGGLVDEFNMRRPIVATFLAVRLALTNRDFQLALILQAWLAGAAAYLAARALARTHGLASGLFALALLYEFARPYLGTTLSESLGLSFGCLGFAVLWTVAARRAAPPAVLLGGMALVTLGLLARPGAYTVVGALMLWAALALRPRAAWKSAAWAVAGVVLALLLNASFYWQFGTGSGQANANFSYSLYGLTAGGKTWAASLAEQPGCTALPSEKERAACFYARALERFRERPGLTYQGIRIGLDLYKSAMFGFIGEASSIMWRPREARWDDPAMPLARTLAMAAVIGLAVRRKDAGLWLLLLVGLAIVACSPLLADGGNRVYAATVPFTVALPAAGLGLLTRWRSPAAEETADATASPAAWPDPARAALALGGGLVLVGMIGAPVAIVLQARPRFAVPVCEPGLYPVIFGLDHGSLTLGILGGGPRLRTSDLLYEDWRADPGFGDNESAPVWRKVKAGDRIVLAYDCSPRRGNPQVFWLILPGGLDIPGGGQFLKACIRRDPRALRPEVFRAKSLEAVRPLSLEREWPWADRRGSSSSP